jgi:hypothetical protein
VEGVAVNTFGGMGGMRFGLIKDALEKSDRKKAKKGRKGGGGRKAAAAPPKRGGGGGGGGGGHAGH